jgi:hypothetical protein
VKNILILGDSFTYGQGCKDRLAIDMNFLWPSEYCWASLLAKDYPDYKIVNLARPGADNTSMSLLAQNNINSDTHLVMFNVTPPDRLPIRNEYGEGLVTWQLSEENNKNTNPNIAMGVAKQAFLKYMYHEKLLNMISVNAILAAYSAANIMGVKFIMSCPYMYELQNESAAFSILRGTHNIPNILLLTNQGSEGCDFEIDHSMIAPDYHANEIGHKHYYDNFIKPSVKDHL